MEKGKAVKLPCLFSLSSATAPHLYELVSSAGEEALEEFTETYADALVDALVDGDTESWARLASSETLAEAAQSALGGAAGGLLISAGAQGMGALSQEREASAHAEDGKPSQLQALSAAQSADGGVAGSSPEGRAKNQGSTKGEPGVEEVTLAGNEKTPAGEQAVQDNTDVRYSIQVDEDGKKYVQIDSDILDGVSPENELTVVRDAIRDMFPDGFERDGKRIHNTREGRGEFVRSKYSRGLEKAEPETHSDKMRMAANLDEIISTSGNVKYEEAHHKNAEGFNRGTVNVRVGGNDYRVDVLTAVKNDGREVAYDIVNIQPTTIKASDEKTSEAFGEPRRTIADPAEGGNRGLPGYPLSAEAKTTVQESTGSSSAQNPATNITPGGEKVKGESYADLDLKADAQSLNAEGWDRAEQMDAARQLVSNARMSSAGVQTVVNNMPQGVGAAIYAPAAASLYRLGVVEDVASFDEALRLTGAGGVSGRVQQVLALGETGRKALQIAFLQGKGEAEQYRATKATELGARPGAEALREDAGIFIKNGKLSEGKSRRDALIELTAKGTGVAAEQKAQLRGNAKGVIQTAVGKVFYSQNADAATILHETLHEVNSWSNETGQELLDIFHRYLVQQNGMDSVQELLQGYMDRYERAGQRLSYNQALEEATADAMQTIFGTEESFRNFVRLQAAEARMNAVAQQRTDSVMAKIETLLKKVLTDLKSFLGMDPDNAAAKAAKSLTEQQLRDLQELYFAHQIEAGANYRAALEEAGGMKKAASAQDTAAESRYSLPEMASETEQEKAERQMTMTIRAAQQNAERTKAVSGENWSGQKPQNVHKAIRSILQQFGLLAKDFRVEDLDIEYRYSGNHIRESANKQKDISSVEYNDFALIHANIEEVLANAVPLEAHADKKGTGNVEGMIVLASALRDGERIIPVRAELKLCKGLSPSLYMMVSETTAEESRNAANKKSSGSEESGDAQMRTRQTPTTAFTSSGSEDEGGTVSNSPKHPTTARALSITEFYDLVKHDPNFTKYFADEVAYKAEGVDALKAESRELAKQKRENTNARNAWMDSESVKRIEAQRKQYGLFSPEAKAFKASAVYQEYLNQRKAWDAKGEALSQRIAQTDEKLKAAEARLDARKAAQNEDKQYAWDALAKANGGKENYHRQLALEAFGTTEDFAKAAYILPDGKMLDFSQGTDSRGLDHRNILDVFGPAEVKDGSAALAQFMQEGNVRSMPESPGVDLAAGAKPTAQQLEQIRKMAQQLGEEAGRFTLDISTKEGRVAASKEYSGKIRADKVVQDIREYYRTGELPGESELAKYRYQLDVDEVDVDAAREQSVGDGGAETKTIQTVMEMAENAKVSEESLGALAKKLVKRTASRADVALVTRRLAALNDYLAAGKVDWAVAHSIMLDISQTVMEQSAKRNDELWKQYPDLHKMSMQIEKGSSDYEEIVYRWGSWGEARKELARHGVKLTLTKDGAASRWDADFTELQKIGEGLLPAEVPNSAADALDAMAAAHDAIRPTMESAYDTDWDAAKQEIAMQLWGDYLGMPGIANAANAKARTEFAKQADALNRQAKEHTIELTMKAKLAAENARAAQRATERADKAEAALRRAGARAERAEGAQQRAEDRAAKQKEFAKKQREAVTERVELEKLKGKERLQKARDARENDNTRRAIRKAASQLTKTD